MNWIHGNNRDDVSVTDGSGRINRLFFADNLVLTASSQQGLQRAFDRFSAACAGLKIVTKKTEVLGLCLKAVHAASERQ